MVGFLQEPIELLYHNRSKEEEPLEDTFTETPDIITYVNREQSKLMIEISLVGVEEEDITLMMDEKGCFFSASSEGDMEYVGTIPFLREVTPSAAKAAYVDSFLKIEVPFKDTLENFIQVPVAAIDENDAE